MVASDILFFGMYILGPLVLLIVSRLFTRFPLLMACLLFFLGPFAGTSVLCVIAEESKAHPMTANIPGAILFFYLVFGLPMFGLWVAGLGTVGWWCLGRIQSVRQLGIAGRKLASVGLGMAIGPLVVFALYTLCSFDPNWPKPDKIWKAIYDPISIISIISQGVAAGAVCGMVVGFYFDSAAELLQLGDTRA